MLLLSIPFPGISAVWVEISGRRGLESLPFPGKNHCLGRDSRHHAPPRHTLPRHTSPQHTHSTPHHGTPYHGTPHHGTPHYGITHHYGDTSRCCFFTHFILLLYFIREIIDFNEHQPRIKRG